MHQRLQLPPSRREEAPWWRNKVAVLLVLSLLHLGASVAYGTPSALSVDLEQGLNISSAELGSLYGYYNIPNVILPIVTGLAVDVVGLRVSLIVLWSVSFLGAVLTAIGAQISSYLTLAVGQFLLGAGLESGFVPLDGAISTWWASNLELAYGIDGGVGSLGTLVSEIALPQLTRLFEFRLVIWISLVCGILMPLGALLYALLDYLAIGKERSEQIRPQNGSLINESEKETTSLIYSPRPPWSEKMKLLLKSFSGTFWFLILVPNAIAYALSFNFASWLPTYLHARYQFGSVDAPILVAIVSGTGALTGPLIGLFLGRLPRKRPLAALIASLIALTSILLLISFPGNRTTMYIALAMLGVFNGSLNPSIWASVGAYSTLDSFGFVFGVGNCTYNILSLGLNYLVGYLSKAHGQEAVGYIWLAVVCLLIASHVLWLLFVHRDGKRREILD